MNHLKYYKFFSYLGTSLSFTETANRMNCSVSQISKRLSELEKDIGVRLITRNTRNLALTESGQMYLETCLKAVDEFNKVEDQFVEGQGRVDKVVLQFVCSSQTHLEFEILSGFLKSNPTIQLEVIYTDEFLDVDENYIDFSLVTGHKPQANYPVHEVFHTDYELYAAPSFLEQYSEFTDPEQLKATPCVLMDDKPWELVKGENRGETFKFQPSGRSKIINLQGQTDFAVRGMGVARLSSGIAHEHVVSGALVNILPGWHQPMKHYLIIRETSYVPMKIQILKDYFGKLLDLEFDSEEDKALVGQAKEVISHINKNL